MNYKRRDRVVGPTWIVIVAVFLGIVNFADDAVAQEHRDAVLDAVVQVATAAGRLLPVAVHGAAFDGASPVRSVSVGAVTHDATTPTIADILKSVTEEELFRVARTMPRDGEIAVLTDRTDTDLIVRIRSTAGTQRVLFSIQFTDGDGRVVAGSRVDVAADAALLNALRPVAATTTRGGADDTADTPAGAYILEPGDTLVDRRLERNGDADWYTLTVSELPAETPGDAPGVRIYTTGTTDTYLEAYGPDSPDILITENDDSDNANAAVTIPVTAGGQYWIKVRGFADTTTGPYNLATELITIVRDAAEPNNDRSEATVLTEDALPFVATIRPAGDVDWYYLPAALIELPEREPDAARLRNVNTIATTGLLDTTLTLYDQTGMEIGYNDDGGEGSNARIVLPDVSDHGGDGVYIEVRGYGSSVEGEYTLRLGTETLTFDRYEPDDTAADAAPIEWNAAPQRRTFSSDADVDWIRLDVPTEAGPTSIVIETYGGIDTFMTLYNADEVEIASDDDGGYGINARIERELAPGRYYVTVRPLYLDGMDAEYSVEARTR
ncbi:MAG: hypothetical protein PF508_08935 [Spirochaeta sp.]|jgi:hypothetical protein|nr:hypothetical protein [Spirochaeta sp.]